MTPEPPVPQELDEVPAAEGARRTLTRLRAPRNWRTLTLTLVVTAVVLVGIATIFAFVLALTREDASWVDQHLVWLFGANIAASITLLAVIVGALVRLGRRLKAGKFGSRLLVKLAFLLGLVGVLPGALVYAVSYQFVTRSFEVWFDQRVQSALNAGLALGRLTLDTLQADLKSRTLAGADRLALAPAKVTVADLERLRDQLGASRVTWLDGRGQVLQSADVSGQPLRLVRVPPTLVRQARAARVASEYDGLDIAGDVPAEGPPDSLSVTLRALAWVPGSSLSLRTDNDHYLMVSQTVPPTLAWQALSVQQAYSEYQQRALGRDGLRSAYIGTLTMALVLALFGAFLLASVLGNQLLTPLLLLAQGVEQVARGNLRSRPTFASNDELGGLTRAFAEMTDQLADARAQVQRGVNQIVTTRTRLQTILDNLSAGVLVFDSQGLLETANPGASRILQVDFYPLIGQPLHRSPELRGLAVTVDEHFQRLIQQAPGQAQTQWEESFDYVHSKAELSLTLMLRVAVLPGNNRLLVFDDISQMVAHQRVQAWGEVAKRLAHEIKNPLTPIQLAAERLQRKLDAKLDEADRALLTRSVSTIVAQVQAMIRLVNEFRDYGRLPKAQLKAVSLADEITGILPLYGGALERGLLHVETAPDLPAIRADSTQLRQVIHNLVQNAMDAVAGQDDGQVWLRALPRRGADGRVSHVTLLVQDNGPGFAPGVEKRIFEPYVTTKTKGTGLGLPMVKKIAEEHHALISASSLGAAPGGSPELEAKSAHRGAQVSLSFPVDAPVLQV
ncbi:ATP-binding protein [Amphibiibacter pelophylacis]|uniref:ATP-binding protein n=1 Tax=Amphibiibacter pelophylacis TaxID=1799477 RepID=A0ACC6P2K5_9BURK